MSLFPSPAPEDPEINGLTCPGYYERKLAEVDARLAAQRAGYGAARRKLLGVRMWMKLVFAAIALCAIFMMGGWGALAALVRR